MRYPRPKKNGDLLVVVVLVAFGLALLSFAIMLPDTRSQFIWGFGPQWDCGDSTGITMTCELKR